MKEKKILMMIAIKYKENIIRKGCEFLFPIKLAPDVLFDLEKGNIPLLGVTTWHIVKLLDGTFGIAESLEFSFAVPEELLEQDEINSKSYHMIAAYIANIPKHLDYVSFDLYSTYLWE